MAEQKPQLKAGEVAERSLYATKDGRLVEEDDPQANELVVAAGTPVSEKMAKRFGAAAGSGAAEGGAGTVYPSTAAPPAVPPEAKADEPKTEEAPKSEPEAAPEAPAPGRVSKSQK